MPPVARNVTLLGCSGGVARGLLGILDAAIQRSGDPLHDWIKNARIHCCDLRIPPDFATDRSAALRERLHARIVDGGDDPWLADHLRTENIDLLVDLTGGDCRAALEACAATDTRYLNSAIEITGDMNCEPTRILEEMDIFQSLRERYAGRLSGIVGAGMNPGVVQWLALDLMRREREAGRGETPLACYVVENDTTFLADPSLADPERAYTTWSPAGFLYEAVHGRPIFMHKGTPIALWNQVYAQEFRVRLGTDEFFGHLMAHEEVLSLGRLFEMETAFLYRINDHSCEVLARAARERPRTEPSCGTLVPGRDRLIGADLVGILLVYPDREVYAFNRLEGDSTFERFGVNATYYQVASGTAAALCCLLFDDVPRDLYYVDELLLNTDARFGTFLNSYLPDFQYGSNPWSDGLLLERMRKLS